ncbi:hypothetical protein BaRGS_00009626 [Batillaria attramentaria]|uniref:DNA oxidative demethylase ALKBH2 n=1 Tax=Batillaria attramentaria TaxID=370345 RepID=A0ABD0LHW0_9CAEN
MSLDSFVIRGKKRASGGEVCSSETRGSGKKRKVEDVKSSDDKSQLPWKKLRAENLDLDYVRLYSKKEADDLLKELENALEYNTGHLARVQMFGKWIDIPRKQVAHGEAGLSYTFSGNTIPARPWNPALTRIRDYISSVTGFDFNFVLVNRYKDGCDYMGEHKDDEKDLVQGYPIASLSLGQPRDFYFKHQDSRGKNAARKIDIVKLELEHGGLLLMNPPTNQFWYHALPQRKKLGNVRINMTFRKMNPSVCKPVKQGISPK